MPDQASRPAPRVSVVMTTFNREDYVAEAIESVLAQTFHDLELVIVDDASTDGTVAIARRYERADPRVRVFVNERNLGDYPNRNYAATLVRGELFKYHDSDDVMYPWCLQVMVAALDAEPSADFGLTASRAWQGGRTPMLLTPEMSFAREYLGDGMFHGGPACGLFRRAWFETTGGFEAHSTVSDYFFWLRVCRTARVVLVSADLFWYRIHADQENQSSAAARGELEAEHAAWAALFDASCPLRGVALEQARRNRLTGLLRRASRDAMSGRVRHGLARLRAADVAWRHWVRYVGGRRFDVAAGAPRWHPS